MNLAGTFADFALDARPTDAAMAMLRLSLFDWSVCGLAGVDEPVARTVRDMVLDEGGTAAATLLGGGRAPARAAALLNGTVSHALDYDDTHFAHIGHPSVAVIPAALAAAEVSGTDMEGFVRAALAGAETSIRFGIWLGREHYQAGFHQTATAGAVGATVAAGRLLGLDCDRLTHGLGLVATRASGLKVQFGTMCKPFNAGIAASNGVEAALLAARGFVSNPAALDAEHGFGSTHAGTADGAALDGLGRDWLFEGVSHKFHACCHGLHAMLEAIETLSPAGGPVASVAVRAHPRWASVCDIARPVTGLEAKFSFRLTAAMALSGVPTAALASFSARTAADPDLVALRDRVTVIFDDALAETAAEVSLTLEDGRTMTATHDLAAPMDLATRQRRLRAKAAACLGDVRADRLWEAAQGDDLARLVALLGAD